ncbi:type III-B CRISPR module-associated protein Cmr5 [Deltaproteobacteria bacterium TL4]
MQTKNQKYSDLVFKKIEQLKMEKGEDKPVKRYKSLCKRAGGVMRTVGLIQFLTFLAAKATKPREVHHQYLLDHLTQELHAMRLVTATDSRTLLEMVRRQNLPEYMQTTKEVLRFLQWHKRIADILIEGTAEEGDEV